MRKAPLVYGPSVLGSLRLVSHNHYTEREGERGGRGGRWSGLRPRAFLRYFFSSPASVTHTHYSHTHTHSTKVYLTLSPHTHTHTHTHTRTHTHIFGRTDYRRPHSLYPVTQLSLCTVGRCCAVQCSPRASQGRRRPQWTRRCVFIATQGDEGERVCVCV